MRKDPSDVGRVISGRAKGIGYIACLAAAIWLAAASGVYGPKASEPDLPQPSATIYAERPYPVSFPPQAARFVRVVIQQTSRSQPCIDELELYADEGEDNLALASTGAVASASSCLPGYAIHQIAHLNDGRYGNAHSWIAAGATNEWAQIELPRRITLTRVVISRDRDGKYQDRVPEHFTICTSLDGKQWQTVCQVQARAPAQPRPQAQYVGKYRLPTNSSWSSMLEYAFLCEQGTWQHISGSDHLSPLRADRPAIPGGDPYWGRIARLDALERTLVQLDEMIERLAERGLDVSQERVELASLQRQRKEQGQAENDRLYLSARAVKRQLMLRDPQLAALQKILFVKRHPYHASHNYSDILDSRFDSGGGICVLHIPRLDGRLTPETARVTTLFDASEGIARDPIASFDGQQIYFAYRPEESPVAGWSPYWHLMVVQADGSRSSQLTDGPYHDFHPCPLPDGGLAFISTRVRAKFLCWRPQAFVLFRMDAFGQDLRPLSFANLSEWAPGLMHDGRILWTRSEYLDKGADFGHTLWAIHPDGTHAELIYGNNTPNCYINGREVPASREICCTLFSHGGDHNGPIGLIDRSKSPFDSSAITNITPDVAPHYNMSWPKYECFRDPTPVSRDYFLVSHAPGERFGLYVIDRYGNRELLYIDPTIGSMCPTPLGPRSRPPVLPSGLDATLAESGEAILSLADVYQGISPKIARGEVKYLRVCQEVRAELIELPDGQCQSDHQPFQDWYATPIHKVSGPHGWPSYVAKASLGIVPVSEDGSATFTVPAGKAVYFEVLDAEFNELQRMRSVVQLYPGEQRGCIGCHDNRRHTPLRKADLVADFEPSPLTLPPWGPTAFSYERTVQPVWNSHCVQCHDGTSEPRIDLSGKLDQDKVPVSYRTLIQGGWVHYFDYKYQLRHSKAEPKSFGTLQSKLAATLTPDHHSVQLSEPEMRAVKCWIDLNCPLWPDYQFRPRRPAGASVAREPDMACPL